MTLLFTIMFMSKLVAIEPPHLSSIILYLQLVWAWLTVANFQKTISMTLLFTTIFMSKVVAIEPPSFIMHNILSKTSVSMADNSKFTGKTFHVAELTHERFLTVDHSCEIFFWYLPNWTFTKRSKSAKFDFQSQFSMSKKSLNLSKIKNSLKYINLGQHFL